MAFDPSTLCARTAAGEAELATPSQGLALGQRRVLALLDSPVAVDELAARHRLEPDKLARDLTRLADLKLVVLQGPSIAAAPPPRATAGDAETMAPVVIGRSARRTPMLPLAAGIAAVVLAAGIWYGTRASPAPAATPSATAPAPAPPPAALAPVPVPSVDNAVNSFAADVSPATPVPAPTLMPRESTPPALARPSSRTEVIGIAAAAARIATAPISPVPNIAPRPEIANTPPTVAPAATAPVVAAPPAPATVAAPVPTAVADNPPPVQIATAAPSSAALRPAPGAGLKAISREPPDFPKEAVAEGLTSGLVNARIHIDARGNVTGVDILRSQPPKVFDRATRRALLHWQFEPNAAGQSSDLDVDVKFQRD
jgi:TonB family protein